MYTLHTHEKEASDVKKRILPMFLALVMLLTLLPAPLASAAGTSVYNGTKGHQDDSVKLIPKFCGGKGMCAFVLNGNKGAD